MQSETTITDSAKERFAQNGFIHLKGVVSSEIVSAVRSRFEPMFRGEFETGIYPDEWHWREGLSRDDAFREIVNGWKSDLTIRSVVLSKTLGKIACDLLDWPGARVAQDDLLWKPPQTKGVGIHRDSTYISKQFVPYENNSVTIWVALDDADSNSGVVQYLPGSHLLFNSTPDTKGFFQDEKKPLLAQEKFVALSVKAGDVLIHHQDILHGSSNNLTLNQPRRALGVHLIRSDVKFNPCRKPDYIYGRYKLNNDDSLRDEFFPVTYLVNSNKSKL